MTKQNPRDALARFLEELADGAMQTDGQELAEELRTAGLDPEKEAGRVRNVIDAAIAEAGRRRLERSRAAYAARVRAPTAMRQLSAEQKRAILERVVANDDELKGKLTLAARKGEGASEADLDSLFDDLVELGAIDEDGELR